MKNNTSVLAELGTAVGAGLIAGLAGTLAMTLSKKLDKKTDERKCEKAMLELTDRVLDLKPSSEEKTEKVVEELHWAYGASCGVTRGLLNFIGMRGLAASITHFVLMWFEEKVMLPDMKKVYPGMESVKSVSEEEPGAIARDSIHLAIYALVTGFVFDAITSK